MDGNIAEKPKLLIWSKIPTNKRKNHNGRERE
jgi:hypothetical protein